MSGFSGDWLALRGPSDTAARARSVLDAARGHFAAATGMSICDLGSGTGASVRAFSPLFPTPQRWQLVDLDAANLRIAEMGHSGSDALTGVTVATRAHDLAADPAPWNPGTDLVTATALFDLTSATWLHRFANTLATSNLPLLATLTYDGRHVFDPILPLDAEMCAAFDTHQTTDKGFGPAAGPSAVTDLTRALHDAGYQITQADSAWNLERSRDGALMMELLDGWANAVIEKDLVPARKVIDWHAARRGQTARLLVGHQDIFATPAS